MKIINLSIALIANTVAVSTTIPWVIAQPTQIAQIDSTFSYGTNRRPRTCTSRLSPKKGALNAEQAKMYFICDAEKWHGTEVQGSSFFRLVDVQQIQVAPVPRKATFDDIDWGRKISAINTNLPVYDIRGTYISYACFGGVMEYESVRGRIIKKEKGKDCHINQNTNREGFCFRNTFGDWHCVLDKSYTNTVRGIPPEN
jgi:hypothetical protein